MTEKRPEMDPEFLKHVLDDKSAEKQQRAIAAHVAKNPALKHAIAERNALVEEDDEKRLGLGKEVADRMLERIAQQVAATVATPEVPTPTIPAVTKPQLAAPRAEKLPFVVATDETLPASSRKRSSWVLPLGLVLALGGVAVVLWLTLGRDGQAVPAPIPTTSAAQAEPSTSTTSTMSPPETTTAATTAPPTPSVSAPPTVSVKPLPSSAPTPSAKPSPFGTGWTIHDKGK